MLIAKLSGTVVGALALTFFFFNQSQAAEGGVRDFAEKQVFWHGHDGFEIRGSVVVVIDPYQITSAVAADIILITHPHFDHLSAGDIQKIRKTGTVLVAADHQDSRARLSGDVRYVKPGDRLTVKGVTIQAVPAYNPGKTFHPRDNGWVGYVFTLDNTTIYHAGDTDRIPEMNSIKADIALLPVGGKYTMDAKEAAAAAGDMALKLAIPMHYGSVVGTTKDAEAFRDALKGKVAVVIKQPQQPLQK